MSEKEAKTVPSKKVNIVRGFKKGRGDLMEANVVGQKQLYDYASGPQTGKDTEAPGPRAAESKFEKESKKGQVKHRKYPIYKAKGGRVKKRKNTRRMNRLEELGRVDAEKAFTKKGKKNLKAEKKRIVRELKSSGGSAGVALRGKGCEIR